MHNMIEGDAKSESIHFAVDGSLMRSIHGMTGQEERLFLHQVILKAKLPPTIIQVYVDSCASSGMSTSEVFIIGGKDAATQIKATLEDDTAPAVSTLHSTSVVRSAMVCRFACVLGDNKTCVVFLAPQLYHPVSKESSHRSLHVSSVQHWSSSSFTTVFNDPAKTWQWQSFVMHKDSKLTVPIHSMNNLPFLATSTAKQALESGMRLISPHTNAPYDECLELQRLYKHMVAHKHAKPWYSPLLKKMYRSFPFIREKFSSP